MNKRIKKKKLKKINDKLDMILNKVFEKFEPSEEKHDGNSEVMFSNEHEEKMRKLFE